MRIPPYWAKETYTGTDRDGREHTFVATGWSFRSQAEAEQDAIERAKRICEHIRREEEPDEYDYLDRPLREEIVSSLSDEDEEIANITRNRYGALVLNTAGVCFVDIDFPPPEFHGFLDSLLSLFSSGIRKKRLKEGREATFRSVREWAAKNPDHSFRIYRTHAGLRLLFTDRLYDPTAPTTLEMLDELDSDYLYRRLTEQQECFRARLTAKPWRCGCERPPNRYPWADPQEERTYRRWQRRYEEKSAPYAACRFVEAIGNHQPDGQIGEIITIHDRFARASEEDVELA